MFAKLKCHFYASFYLWDFMYKHSITFFYFVYSLLFWVSVSVKYTLLGVLVFVSYKLE